MRRTIAIVGMASWLTSLLAAAEPPKPTDKEAEKPALQAAASHVRRLELRDVDGDQIDLIERPLLAYADPARVNSNGTVWAWGNSGRPIAFLELFQGSAKDTNWVHAVTVTAPRQVILAIPEVGRWQPSVGGIESRVIDDAPPADEKPSTRLRQIKELARRFSAHEFWDPDNSRFELRVLPQPVLRYSDPAAEIQDGAAFIIAHGTNPETVLLIEALGASPSSSRWHYALARSSHAEAHVELDGREVWKCDRTNPSNTGPTRSYWLFTSPIENAAPADGPRDVDAAAGDLP
jgi:hypothetical protein